MKSLPLDVLHLIGVACDDPVDYERLAYAVDHRLLTDKILRMVAIEHFTRVTVDIYGTQVWRVNGKLHREGDKPAVIHPSGTQMWYVNGNVHREGDKPAVINTDGTQMWVVNGRLIR